VEHVGNAQAGQKTVPRAGAAAGPVRGPAVSGWMALGIVWFVWGGTYLAIRVGVESVPPFLLAGVRYLAAGVILFPFAMRSLPAAPRPRRVPWPRMAEWRGSAVVGILLLLGGNGLVTVGERTVPSGFAALLVATVPLWLLGMDALANRAPVRPAAVIGLIVGLAGVGLLAGVGRGGLSASGLGVLVILVAAMSWALGTILAGKVTLPSSPLLAAAMQMLTGGTVILILAAASGEFGSFRLAAVSGRSLLALAYLIGPGSIVALSAYGVAVRTLPTPAVATYAYVNPVVAVLLGTWLLGEKLTTGMLLGGGLIVVAVALVVRGQPTRDH
jgi:drug/metabolite transporter (DMT)-like permease